MSDQPEWIVVGELAHGFGENNLPDSDGLVGQEFDLHFEQGGVIHHRFNSVQQLEWCYQDESEPSWVTETYSAVNPRAGIYFVDFAKHQEPGSTVSLVLDMNRGWATVVISKMPESTEMQRSLLSRVMAGEPLTPVNVDFLRATLDKPFTEVGENFHAPTEEMVGWRVEYSYAEDEVYEHIYLGPESYTWHCLKGNEKGLCDTDYCRFRKIDDNLYLFVWQEKIVPTTGALLLDFNAQRSCGKIVGYQGREAGELCNFKVGAKAVRLNCTAYPCQQR